MVIIYIIYIIFVRNKQFHFFFFECTAPCGLMEAKSKLPPTVRCEMLDIFCICRLSA